MTYPQPITTTQLVNGADQFRFTTAVGFGSRFTGGCGAGEIYEIDSSCTAIAMGPECDFAQLQVAYLDPSATPSLVSTIRLTPNGPFAGAFTPRLDTDYPNSDGRLGRVLLSLYDIFNGQYRPTGFAVANAGDQIFFVAPIIDVMGWFKVPPAVPNLRGDKTYFFQDYPNPNGNVAYTYWTIIPFYGRKSAYVDFLNRSGQAVTFGIMGVNYTTVDKNTDAATVSLNQETTILAPAAVANNGTAKKVIRASVDGRFDALAISMGGTNAIVNAPLRVTMSDQAL